MELSLSGPPELHITGEDPRRTCHLRSILHQARMPFFLSSYVDQTRAVTSWYILVLHSYGRLT